MSDRHSVIPRTMCFIFNDNDVLLMKGSDKKEWAGKYDPVGGHIEAQEDVLDSALREIQEETGLIPDNASVRGIIHVSNFFHKNKMLFVITATTDTRKVVHGEEGTLEWIPIEQVHEINTFDDVKPIIDAVVALESHQLITGRIVFDDDNIPEVIDLNVREA
ncbi:NUDIX domain-containing protein [candidate division WWE3 bacterium]|uniref:NUDIX domain-containing protein n=1 Tax=candidate division WWE3 bacterium TaxID=2053526 RepID=A0A955RXI7_UNCKA|nr:NUDIX domain-containing protein [candidate division WWE3 bacterium]